MTPFVSVVVPSHNRARLLSRTLQSILAQQMGDLEVVVVDDGSTDDTASVAAAADPRVVVLRNEAPAGVSAARNRGIAAARGAWMAFCDDDDLWSPEKLAHQLAAAERARADWVYSGDVNVDDGLRVLSGGRLQTLQLWSHCFPAGIPSPPGAPTSWCARSCWRPWAASTPRCAVPRTGIFGFAWREPARRRGYASRSLPTAFTQGISSRSPGDGGRGAPARGPVMGFRWT